MLTIARPLFPQSNVCGTACDTGYSLLDGKCTKASAICAKNCPAIAHGSVTCNEKTATCTYACDGSGYKLTVKNGKATCTKTTVGNTANNCGAVSLLMPLRALLARRMLTTI